MCPKMFVLSQDNTVWLLFFLWWWWLIQGLIASLLITLKSSLVFQDMHCSPSGHDQYQCQGLPRKVTAKTQLQGWKHAKALLRNETLPVCQTLSHVGAGKWCSDKHCKDDTEIRSSGPNKNQSRPTVSLFAHLKTLAIGVRRSKRECPSQSNRSISLPVFITRAPVLVLRIFNHSFSFLRAMQYCWAMPQIPNSTTRIQK